MNSLHGISSYRGLGRPVVLALLGILAFAAPVPAATLLALVDTGELFTSADAGATWSIRSTLPTPDGAGLIAGTSSQDLFLVSESGTVYRTPDAGVNWTAVGTIPASDLVDLAARSDGALLVLSRSGTVWISLDQGAIFTAQGTVSASNHVALLVAADQSLYALTATGEVARSQDNGVSWTTVGTLPVPDAVSLRRLDSTFYVLTGTGLTYRSMDSGATWTAVGTVSQMGMAGLTPLESELVAVNRAGLVARSADGSAWTWAGTVNQLEVVVVASDTPQVTGIREDPATTPRLVLAPPRPNPVRAGGTVQLAFELPEAGDVGLALFDVRGRPVAERARQRFEAGASNMSWTLPPLASGIYFLKLKAGEESAAGRLVVTR